MGSGKSHIGKKLSAAMGFGFVDLDDCIELHANQSISAIFNKKGQAAFRHKEQTVLQKTENMERTVIATGGGTACFFDNMKWMNEHGITIFLDAPVSLLVERLLGEKEKRPLLKGKSDEELGMYIDTKMKERAGFYEKAQFKCNVDGSADEIVQYLTAYFKRFI